MTVPSSGSRLPQLAPSDVRALVAMLLVSATLGEGVEPALRGVASDAVVRGVGVLAGWTSAFTTILVLVAVGYLVVRSVLVGRASFARSLLTGCTAAAVAFATMGTMTGRPGPTSFVLLAALAGAFLGARQLAGATLSRLFAPLAVLAFGASSLLSHRAFDSGGVASWVGARAASTLAWGVVTLLVLRSAISVLRAHRAAGLAAAMALPLVAFVTAREGHGAGPTIATFVRRALVDGGVAVPPFALGSLPYVLPTAARVFAWAALVVVPFEAFGGLWVVAFLPALPAPLASLAALLACHLEAAGTDDDDARTS
jgi:hypothetical protein